MAVACTIVVTRTTGSRVVVISIRLVSTAGVSVAEIGIGVSVVVDIVCDTSMDLEAVVMVELVTAAVAS